MTKIVVLATMLLSFSNTSFANSNFSNEQSGYCNYLKSQWNYSCNSIKKTKYTSKKVRKIVVGCQGPGLGCGGQVFYYTQISNGKCNKGNVDSISYDEIWTYSTKGGSNKIYWLEGQFKYEGVSKQQYFDGFSINGTRFTESMGMDRQWFDCEIPKYIGGK